MPATRRAHGFYAATRAVMALSIAAISVALEAPRSEAQTRSPAFRGGFAGIYGAPIGEFGNYIDRGWGAGGHFVFPFDPAGVVGLRADGAFLVYGHETQRACFSVTVGCRVTLDVNTTNTIALAGLGPELSLPAGPLRPYVNARAGLAYISTTSSVEATRTDENIASTTNYDDLAFSWGAGGGLSVALSRAVGLDIGVTWLDNGRASYLREGDIVDEPDGSISFTPTRSDTDLLLFHLGLSIGRGAR